MSDQMKHRMEHSSADPAGPQRGVVLLVVLWIVLAMGLLGMSFAGAIRTELNAARNVIDQKQAYYLSRAGIEYAVYKLLEARSAFSQAEQALAGEFDQVPDVLSGKVTLRMDNGSADVEILDESGKINLNAPASQTQLDLIYNLLIMVGVDPTEADVITDSIADWVDPDEFPNPLGAESDYYLSLDPPYMATNGPFTVPEELLLVQGVTPELYYGTKGLSEDGEKVQYYGLQNYFTVFGTGGRINANAAPLPVLAALPYLDEATASQIFELRQEGPFGNGRQLTDALPGLDSNVASLLGSSPNATVYGVTSVGHLTDSKVVSRIRCVVELSPGSPRGYSILYWNESATEL